MDEKTAETLRELHGMLRGIDSLDEGDRQLVAELQDDIQALLAHGGDHRSFTTRLRAATQRFEVSHPALTEAFGRTLDALIQMGI